MKSSRVAALLLAILASCGAAATRALAASPQPGCFVPVDKLLHRFVLDVPGTTRITRSVEIPANTEVLIEAFEFHVNARLEVQAPGSEVLSAETALHRWPPHRLIIASGPARKVDVSVIGLERSTGKVDVRMSRVTAATDRRCTDFWRAMADGDAEYSRGAMIFRAEIEAPSGTAAHANEAAIEAYARAARALGPGGLDEAQAQVVRAAVLMNSVERFPEAMEAAAQAQAHYEALHDDYGRDIAKFHRTYSLTYEAMHTNDAAAARHKFETARRAFVDLAASHLRRGERFEQALALDGLACTDGFLFNFADAIAEYQQTLEIFEQLHEADRAFPIRQNLAYFESQFGRFREALKRHLEILADGANIKDSAAYLGNLRNIAWLEIQLGQYDAALRHYSETYARSLRMQSPRDQAWALYGLGRTYHAIGNFSEALSYLERSLDLRPDLQRPRDRSLTLRIMADVLSDSGRLREAIARREEAMRDSRIPVEKARITLELIDDRIEAGDLAIAKALVAPLLAANDLPDPGVRIGATLAGARIALAEGDAARAARDSRAAADFYQAHELVSSEFDALVVRARAACAAGDRDQALEIAQHALQRAEEIRTFSNNPTLRASVWRPLRPAFGFAIGLLGRADSCGTTAAVDPLGALAVAEASRGRALEDFRFRSDEATGRRTRAGSRRELFDQLAGIRQQLETLSQTGPTDDQRMEILRTEAARLRREIDLSGGLPESSRHRPDDLRAALRARLDAIPDDTAVVEYWVGKEEAFAWLLTRGRAQLVDLGPAGPIDSAARRMYDEMHTWVAGSVESRIARAQELHALIIAPLPADLGRARTVYFIPDGALHAVPFAALADGRRTGAGFFVDSHDVAVAPAFLAISYEAPRQLTPGKSAALVVVDPVYAREDGRFSRPKELPTASPTAAITLRGSRSWARLPGTAREAATISRLLGTDAVQVLSGFDASRDVLLGRDLSRFDILHFATHAVADTEAPQLSALILSTVDAQGKPRVGEVFAGDLADQKLDASLVVLSGCETALGRAEAGEGLLGLRYAAHASGARAVIASLWPVEDAAGARLMNDLYADVISRHASPVAALSRAARAARARWKDPALWAAFDVSVATF